MKRSQAKIFIVTGFAMYIWSTLFAKVRRKISINNALMSIKNSLKYLNKSILENNTTYSIQLKIIMSQVLLLNPFWTINESYIHLFTESC